MQALKRFHTLWLSWLFLLGSGQMVFAEDWQAQRNAFNSAQIALKLEQFALYESLAASLENYPLYPYLEAEYLRRNPLASTQRRQQFIERYQDTRFVKPVQQRWLRELADTEQWAAYLQVYQLAPKAKPLPAQYQCLALQAHNALGEPVAAFLDEVQALWLVGYSQHKACDPLFTYLYDSPRFTDELIWQRFQFAMRNNQVGLAKYLDKRFSSNTYTVLADTWLALYQEPASALASVNLQDSAVVQEMIVQGMRRLARKQADVAYPLWQVLKQRYAFPTETRYEIDRYLAVRAAAYDKPEALSWLQALPTAALNEEAVEAWFKLALAAQDWKDVLRAISSLSAAEQQALQWRYWYARALAQTGYARQAAQIFEELAAERDYYGYLAADRLGLPHQLADKPLQVSEAESNALLNRNAPLLRAREFFWLGLETEARRSWTVATQEASQRELEIAVVLADAWGWHSQAIMTASKANAYDDVMRRFPLLYQAEIRAAADEQGIDMAWIYGIIRQESVFMDKVVSRAGAKGLMQLMPATARNMAAKIDLPLSSDSDVLTPENNVRMGSKYLSLMLERFDNHYIFATAAYNAGPGRPDRWRLEHSCLEPDAWIELIPFKETRGYVKSVLTYTAIYAQRLQRPAEKLRLSAINTELCQQN